MSVFSIQITSPLLLSDDMHSFSLLLHFSEASFAHLQVAAEFASKIGSKELQSHLYIPSEFTNFYKMFLVNH